GRRAATRGLSRYEQTSPKHRPTASTGFESRSAGPSTAIGEPRRATPRGPSVSRQLPQGDTTNTNVVGQRYQAAAKFGPTFHPLGPSPLWRSGIIEIIFSIRPSRR